MTDAVITNTDQKLAQMSADSGYCSDARGFRQFLTRGLNKIAAA